ncbi:MAG: hypothetical protein IKA02_02785 [Clostridia bacterium]|nr:hypothetical protein [Clostridia bacterium]
MDEIIRTFAQNNGYDGIRKSIKWSGYNVYEPFCYGYDDYSGCSIFILVKNGDIRTATIQESKILNGIIKHC